MPVDPVIEEHWPQLAALHRTLDALDGRTVTVRRHVQKVTDRDVDEIHAALLRKQQSGSLGLNK